MPKLLFLYFFLFLHFFIINYPSITSRTPLEIMGFMGYPDEQCPYFCKQCFHKFCDNFFCAIVYHSITELTNLSYNHVSVE